MEMKGIHRSFILILFFSFYYSTGFSQVSGISYTLSPIIEYTWWDDKAGLEDGLLWGGKLGLGFGEYIELRGQYMRSINLTTRFKDFGLANYSDSLFTERPVTLARWGGELKANLSRGKVLPYLTIGTGVQSIQLDTFAQNKQVYVSFGGGVKLSASDRYTLTLEARNNGYNFNSVANLLTASDQSALDIDPSLFSAERLRSNWSVGASLQVYLGGRKPGEMTELDKAYFDTFSGGLRGLRVPIEPTLARVNFTENMPYRDTWMIGGYTGLDFNSFIGVRGFYFQATEDGELSSKFDKLAMYGGELRLKLNASGGITPYLIMGGGYIDIDQGKYISKDSLQATDQGFASGGVGITLPISTHFKLFGSARALLSTATKVEALQTTDQLETSWMYAFGVRFVLGKKSNPEEVMKAEINEALQVQQDANDENARLLKEKYETKVVSLEAEIMEAYAAKDIEQAAKLLQEKEEADLIVEELKKREQKQLAEAEQAKIASVIIPPATVYPTAQNQSQIQLSPAEFEGLIEEILEGVNNQGRGNSSFMEQQLLALQHENTLQRQAFEQRIAEIEKALVQMTEAQAEVDEIPAPEQSSSEDSIRADLTAFSAILLQEINKLNEKIDRNNKEIEILKTGGTVNAVIPDPEEVVMPAPIKDTLKTDPVEIIIPVSSGDFIENGTANSSALTYRGMSGFAGINIGGQTTFNTGLRWNYAIGKSKFEFMPELFVGLGSSSSFGFSANGVLPISFKKSDLTPYVGLGGGVLKIENEGEDKLRLNYNIIVGSYINVLNGRLFFDFTTRNLFKYNQAVLGYRFKF